ncbi:MAG TPA: hypothetical protein VHV78_02930 [Gemmatimonadaceae bacterium]|nr:hypothetical protein [Gemmatimonadaceae bacterium]
MFVSIFSYPCDAKPRLAFTPIPSTMTAKLDKTIKRELEIDGKVYTIAISPDGIKVTEKGRRNGPEMTWRSVIGGDSTGTAAADQTGAS